MDKFERETYFIVEYIECLILNYLNLKLNIIEDLLNNEFLKNDVYIKNSISSYICDQITNLTIFQQDEIIQLCNFALTISTDKKIKNEISNQVTLLIIKDKDLFSRCANDTNLQQKIYNVFNFLIELNVKLQNYSNMEKICDFIYNCCVNITYDKKQSVLLINNLFLDSYKKLTKIIKKETGKNENNYIANYKSQYRAFYNITIIVLIFLLLLFFKNYLTNKDDNNLDKSNSSVHINSKNNNITNDVKDNNENLHDRDNNYKSENKIIDKNSDSLIYHNESITDSGFFKNPKLNDLINAAYNGDLKKIESIIQYLSNEQKPIKGNSTLARKLNNEGLIQYKKNDFVAASDLFQKATELDQSDIEILNNYASALDRSSQKDKALSVLEQTLLINAQRTIAWFNVNDIITYQNLPNQLSCGAITLGLIFSKNKDKSLNYLNNQILELQEPDYVKINRKLSLDCAKSIYFKIIDKKYENDESSKIIGKNNFDYYDGKGVGYKSQKNNNGMIFKSSDLTIYIGKSCDVYSPEIGNGNWKLIDQGFIIYIGDNAIYFPRQTLDIDNANKCSN